MSEIYKSVAYANRRDLEEDPDHKIRVEKELINRMLDEIPHEYLVQLFNVKWMQRAMDYDLQVYAEIRLDRRATVDGGTKIYNEELKKQIAENEALHIADVMRSLKNDPNVDDYIKNYDNTEKYLRELIDKDGSLMKGIVYALETYLEK